MSLLTPQGLLSIYWLLMRQNPWAPVRCAAVLSVNVVLVPVALIVVPACHAGSLRAALYSRT
jgi:hypothetical protein